MVKYIRWFILFFLLIVRVKWVFAFHPDIYSPRVPEEQLEMIQEIENPYPRTSERIGKGEQIFFGKGFCITCHNQKSKEITLPGHAPRDFTDLKWQEIRTDGELMWILRNGSPGTGMPVRVGKVITEEEGWNIIHYIRSLLGN